MTILGNVEKKKEYMEKYLSKPEVKERRKKYMKEYRQRSYVKQKQKEYMEKYLQKPDTKQKLRDYYREWSKKPEVKERLRKSNKKYYSKPEIKEKCRAYKKDNRLKLLISQRKWRAKNISKVREYLREYRKSYKVSNEEYEKELIRRRTVYHFPLKNQKCVRCKSAAECHHHNTVPYQYDKFDFMCHKCHVDLHKKLNWGYGTA